MPPREPEFIDLVREAMYLIMSPVMQADFSAKAHWYVRLTIVNYAYSTLSGPFSKFTREVIDEAVERIVKAFGYTNDDYSDSIVTCRYCNEPLHYLKSLGWCETQFSSPACNRVGGHLPKDNEAGRIAMASVNNTNDFGPSDFTL